MNTKTVQSSVPTQHTHGEWEEFALTLSSVPCWAKGGVTTAQVQLISLRCKISTFLLQ